ncbi:DUF2017 domain-containing protein [Aeromicrobium phragmitis]|uniref:DUF2017 domain-containing protein n=1 Tax=Aeromicrobium phragmitis TaxID=2478914 RepID=A0A3L8PMV8_9ACTN|nr:DUF2017 domain-containing protein [Aeromicrobium phragmitis]RLV56695.1 DUF2017 domain-containing protein [Aeromicrobium phragmitis]
MKPFVRRRQTVVGVFEQNEAQLMANLTAQVVELLRDRNGPPESSADPLAAMVGMSGPVQPPEDPVLARLLPDAYRDDPEDAAEFRRYTEQALTSTKVANAETVISTLADGGMSEGAHDDVEVELDQGQVLAWLRALTDVRIALAVRLGIDSDEDAERVADSEDPGTAAMADVYDWLGFVQETLVQAAG